MYRRNTYSVPRKNFSQVFWPVAFWLTLRLRWAVEWLALWVDWLNARCAFRSIGNDKFNNPRHTHVRYETIDR